MSQCPKELKEISDIAKEYKELLDQIDRREMQTSVFGDPKKDAAFNGSILRHNERIFKRLDVLRLRYKQIKGI